MNRFREIKADAWSIPGTDAVCITTNGFISRQGRAAVGLGVAKTASERYPGINLTMAAQLKQHGHITQIIHQPPGEPYLVSFPVKPDAVINDGHNILSFKRRDYQIGALVPGFYAKAQLAMIERSAAELVSLTNKMGWQQVVLPRPGCGAGELSWIEVSSLLSRYLDERFVLVSL